MDLDGDKRLDLVLTKSCSDGTVGVSMWQMFHCLPEADVPLLDVSASGFYAYVNRPPSKHLSPLNYERLTPLAESA